MNKQKITLSITLVCLLGASGQSVTAQTTFNDLFSAPTFMTVGIRPYDVKAADLNGDSKMDLVVANRGPTTSTNGTVSVLLNDGAGGFTAPTTLSGLNDPLVLVEPVSLALHDLNGDGRPDIVVADETQNIVVFLNTGLAQPFDPILTPPFTFVAMLSGVNPTAVVMSVDLGLVDGDTNIDAVIAAFESSQNGSNANINIFLLKGHGDGTFDSPGGLATGSLGNRFIRLTDVTGNGNLDAVVVSSAPGNPVLAGEGSGNHFSFLFNNNKLDVPNHMNEINESAALGDVDNDGKIDVVVATVGFGTDISNMTPSTIVTLFRNISSATSIQFATGVSFTTGELPYSIEMGDLNNDGWLDAAVTHRNSDTVDVSILLNDQSPNGGFGTALEFTFAQGVGLSPRSITLADIDNDGDLDLVTTRKPDSDTGTNGDVVIFKNLTITNGGGGGDDDLDRLRILMGTWGPEGGGTASDYNNDGMVNAADLATLLGNWSDPNDPQQGAPTAPWVIAHFGFDSAASYTSWLELLTEDERFNHIAAMLDLITAP